MLARWGMGVCALTMILCAGCDSGRVAELEKENARLKAQTEKDNSRDFDMQQKCSTAARQWFNAEWAGVSRRPTTILLDYTNHYSKSTNQCMVVVEMHEKDDDKISWINEMTLWNVLENAKQGDFVEDHHISFKPNADGTSGTKDFVVLCEVDGTKCTDNAGFNKLAEPYMSN